MSLAKSLEATRKSKVDTKCFICDKYFEPSTIKAHVDKCMIEWSEKNIKAIPE